VPPLSTPLLPALLLFELAPLLDVAPESLELPQAASKPAHVASAVNSLNDERSERAEPKPSERSLIPEQLRNARATRQKSLLFSTESSKVARVYIRRPLCSSRNPRRDSRRRSSIWDNCSRGFWLCRCSAALANRCRQCANRRLCRTRVRR